MIVDGFVDLVEGFLDFDVCHRRFHVSYDKLDIIAFTPCSFTDKPSDIIYMLKVVVGVERISFFANFSIFKDCSFLGVADGISSLKVYKWDFGDEHVEWLKGKCDLLNAFYTYGLKDNFLRH